MWKSQSSRSDLAAGKRSDIACMPFMSSAVMILILLMIDILHYLKDPKLWELWYIPDYYH